MIPVLSVALMRASDAHTIESGTPSRELMRRAGEGIVEAVEEAGGWHSPVAVVCGSGNNAGDGYVIAARLARRRIPCIVYLLSDRCSEDGAYFAEQAREEGVLFVPWEEGGSLADYGTVVDCIFGTGFRGAVKGAAADAIRAINESGAFVVSADINSGLNGDTGMADCCVVSDLTAAIGGYKPGHFLGMAKDVIRQKISLDIGIAPKEKPYFLFGAADAARAFPKRKNFSNKSTYGYVALIGGSAQYTGAIRLAALANAAMRSGAGVVKVAAPASICPLIAPSILEATLFPLPDADGQTVFDEDAVRTLLRGTRTAAFGMGIGGGRGAEEMLVWLLAHYEGTLVIDADGLNALSRMGPSMLDEKTCRVILTPHNMEFARLLGRDSAADVIADPIPLAKAFAAAHGVTVLLKGSTTVVTDGDDVLLVDRGCPGMATAGSGDVLSGILAAICGAGADPLTAAAAGAWVNGRAGELAEAEYGAVSMIAGDTVSKLPAVIRSLTE
ncbi:MAG: NAD(P)H-hydrate dehydratase [Clostridia bacterium]|nr:NAD(P)H-hydrate dehydratase [Clostridia bacterium]